MSETVLERHYRDRLQSVQQIAGRGERVATAEWNFEDLVTLCLELATSGQQLLDREYTSIFKVPDLTVAWLRERRLAIEELSAKYLELVASLKGFAGSVADVSCGNNQYARLDRAAKQFLDAKQSVLDRWPVGNFKENGQQEDYVDIDVAFAEIAGVDAETWRQRILDRTRQG